MRGLTSVPTLAPALDEKLTTNLPRRFHNLIFLVIHS